MATPRNLILPILLAISSTHSACLLKPTSPPEAAHDEVQLPSQPMVELRPIELRGLRQFLIDPQWTSDQWARIRELEERVDEWDMKWFPLEARVIELKKDLRSLFDRLEIVRTQIPRALELESAHAKRVEILKEDLMMVQRQTIEQQASYQEILRAINHKQQQIVDAEVAGNVELVATLRKELVLLNEKKALSESLLVDLRNRESALQDEALNEVSRLNLAHRNRLDLEAKEKGWTQQFELAQIEKEKIEPDTVLTKMRLSEELRELENWAIPLHTEHLKFELKNETQVSLSGLQIDDAVHNFSIESKNLVNFAFEKQGGVVGFQLLVFRDPIRQLQLMKKISVKMNLVSQLKTRKLLEDSRAKYVVRMQISTLDYKGEVTEIRESLGSWVALR